MEGEFNDYQDGWQDALNGILEKINAGGHFEDYVKEIESWIKRHRNAPPEFIRGIRECIEWWASEN